MNRSIVFLCLLSALSFCKKKEEPPEPEPVPVVITKPQLFVKINGSEYTCNTCFSSYYSGGIWGINFGMGTNNADRFIINFSKPPAIGTYTFVKFGDPSFNYQKDNSYYRGRGILKITAIDTSTNRTISGIAATFSCTTDTSFGNSFLITGGEINVNTH